MIDQTTLWIISICMVMNILTLIVNIGLSFMQLKMYTEYFKDRSQITRKEG